MGVKKLQSVFIRAIGILVIGVALILTSHLAIYIYAVDMGYIFSLNKMSAEVERAKDHLRSVPQIAKADIPTFSDYALYTESGALIKGSVDVTEAREIWSITIDNEEYSKNPYFYTVVNRQDERLILRYKMTAQFSNPYLRNIVPSVDLFLIVLVLLELFTLIIVIGFLFGKYFREKMNSLLHVVSRIEKQDLGFEIEKTKLYEIDQVLDALGHMRSALKTSLTEQWQANKLRQEQITALTHDLKTPLTIIRGNAELLAETNLSDEQMACTAYIKSSSSQMENYMRTLLEVTRSWDHDAINKSPVDTQAFVEEIENQARGLCAVHHLSFEWKGRYTTPQIFVDRELLIRAITNVVSNAVAHTPPEGKVSVVIDEAGDNFIFVIRDTGDGFSAEALQHGTDQFFMDDHSRHSKSHFGIGLYIAHTACQKHGGQLLLENDSPVGAKVTLIIPVFYNMPQKIGKEAVST